MRQTVDWGDQVPSQPTLWGASPLHLNYGHFPNPTPVSEHFNPVDHSINELIRSNRVSVRKAREAHLIDKAMTLEPRGIMNRRDELNY